MGPTSKSEALKVVARCRPLSSQEIIDSRTSIVTVVPPQVKVKASKGDQAFIVDQAFDQDSTQEQVFQSVAVPIIDSVLNGYNGTIFAYGQTGSGKTFTMEGSEELPGVIPRTFEYIAQQVAANSVGCKFVIYLSFLEIYAEEIIDLLVKGKAQASKLEVKDSKERGIYVQGLGQHVVTGVQDMMRKLQLGKRNRKVGETKMNQESSRSHSILTLTIVRVEGSDDATMVAESALLPKGSAAAKGGAAAKAAAGRVSVGKLNLVDLAGSERASKTGAEGDRLKEGIAINKSLSALGNVMAVLAEGKAGTPVPYRDSKLTRLLQDSLGGNSKTVMVANFGPADWNCEETLGTLKFAMRARDIKNDPKINDDPGDAVVKQYKQQAEKLHAEYKEKISKMEEAHADEVSALKMELEAMKAAKAAKEEEAVKVAALQAQLEVFQEEQKQRQQKETEVEALRAQLEDLQVKAEEQANFEAEQAKGQATAAAVAATSSSPSGGKRKSHARYKEEIERLRARIRQMKMEAIGDYEYMMMQSDELARLRAKMLSEAGEERETDSALQGLLEAMAGLEGLTKEQQAELLRLQAITESLQARAVRPRTPLISNNVVIQGEEPQTEASPPPSVPRGGNGRSLREDLGCNMLFEQLVLEMGYEAESARQAIMAMPGSIMDEIIDYIIDKEAIFAAYRRFKASLAAK